MLDPPVFLDVNPYAFLVILDYLRTNELYIPRNVNTALVHKLLAEFGIPFSGFQELESEVQLPPLSVYTNPFEDLNLPPVYDFSSSSSTSNYQDKTKLTVELSNNGKYSKSLDSQQKIIYKKLEPMIFEQILPLISGHVEQGHTRLRIYIVHPDIEPSQIVSNTQDDDIGFPKEYFCADPAKNCPDLTFVAQPKVLDLFKKIILYSTGISEISIDIRNLTVRVETPFGLFESKSFDIPVITMVIPPNCSF
jgi:hypothetical protein